MEPPYSELLLDLRSYLAPIAHSVPRLDRWMAAAECGGGAEVDDDDDDDDGGSSASSLSVDSGDGLPSPSDSLLRNRDLGHVIGIINYCNLHFDALARAVADATVSIRDADLHTPGTTLLVLADRAMLLVPVAVRFCIVALEAGRESVPTTDRAAIATSMCASLLLESITLAGHALFTLSHALPASLDSFEAVSRALATALCYLADRAEERLRGVVAGRDLHDSGRGVISGLPTKDVCRGAVVAAAALVCEAVAVARRWQRCVSTRAKHRSHARKQHRSQQQQPISNAAGDADSDASFVTLGVTPSDASAIQARVFECAVRVIGATAHVAALSAAVAAVELENAGNSSSSGSSSVSVHDVESEHTIGSHSVAAPSGSGSSHTDQSLLGTLATSSCSSRTSESANRIMTGTHAASSALGGLFLPPTSVTGGASPLLGTDSGSLASRSADTDSGGSPILADGSVPTSSALDNNGLANHLLHGIARQSPVLLSHIVSALFRTAAAAIASCTTTAAALDSNGLLTRDSTCSTTAAALVSNGGVTRDSAESSQRMLSTITTAFDEIRHSLILHTAVSLLSGAARQLTAYSPPLQLRLVQAVQRVTAVAVALGVSVDTNFNLDQSCTTPVVTSTPPLLLQPLLPAAFLSTSARALLSLLDYSIAAGVSSSALLLSAATSKLNFAASTAAAAEEGCDEVDVGHRLSVSGDAAKVEVASSSLPWWMHVAASYITQAECATSAAAAAESSAVGSTHRRHPRSTSISTRLVCTAMTTLGHLYTLQQQQQQQQQQPLRSTGSSEAAAMARTPAVSKLKLGEGDGESGECTYCSSSNRAATGSVSGIDAANGSNAHAHGLYSSSSDGANDSIADNNTLGLRSSSSRHFPHLTRDGHPAADATANANAAGAESVAPSSSICFACHCRITLISVSVHAFFRVRLAGSCVLAQQISDYYSTTDGASTNPTSTSSAVAADEALGERGYSSLGSTGATASAGRRIDSSSNNSRGAAVDNDGDGNDDEEEAENDAVSSIAQHAVHVLSSMMMPQAPPLVAGGEGGAASTSTSNIIRAAAADEVEAQSTSTIIRRRVPVSPRELQLERVVCAVGAACLSLPTTVFEDDADVDRAVTQLMKLIVDNDRV